MAHHYQLLQTGELWATVFPFIVSIVIVGCAGTITSGIWSEDCERTNFTYRHEFDGCTFEIPSFACIGRCNSYVQIPSKIWPPERICKCCQRIGEEEIVKMIPSCRKENNWKQVRILQPRKCMCKRCGVIEPSEIIPQEMAIFPNESPINGHFANTYYRHPYND